jgi:tetratricopeptide (TPR) repeat protein
MQVSDAIDCDNLVALVDALDCLKKDAEQKLSIKKATQASMGSDWQSTHTGSANQGVRRSHRISSASQFVSAGSLCVTEDDTESESSNKENVPSTMFHETSPNKQTMRNVAPGILADNLVLLPNHYENRAPHYGTEMPRERHPQVLDGSSNAQAHPAPGTDTQYQAAEDVHNIERQPGPESPHHSLVDHLHQDATIPPFDGFNFGEVPSPQFFNDAFYWLEGHDERASWRGTAAARVEDLMPYGGHERKEVWGVYLPHGMYTAGLVDIIGGATSALLLERLGRCQERLGQYAPAKASHRKVLSLRKEVLGPEHPDTLTSMGNLAGVLVLQGKYEDAEAINRQALALREMVLGREHPDTLTSTSNLALVLGSQVKYEDAEAMNRQALAQRERVLGLEHPDTLTSMNNLAGVLDRQGKYKEAETMHRQTLAISEKMLMPEHPFRLTSMSNLALVLDSQGKYKEAEAMNRQTLAPREKVLGLEHPDTLMSVYCLAYLLAKQYRVDESLILYRRASSGYNTTLRKDHPTTKACDQHHAELCALQEQNQLSGSPSTLDSGTGTSTTKRLKLSRWLAKIGIRRWKHQRA